MDLQKFLEIELDSHSKRKNPRYQLVDGLVKVNREVLVDPNYSKYLAIIFYIFLLFLVVFIIRAGYLQIYKVQEYREKAENNFLRDSVIYPNRGLIFDREGNFLVKNIPYFFIHQNIDKCLIRNDFENQFKKCEDELKTLSQFLDFDLPSVKEKYAPGRVILIRRNLKKEDVTTLISQVNSFQSIELTVIPTRSYLFPESMSHILGYVSESGNFDDKYEGKDGIELFYNEILSGTKGYTQRKFDSQNNVIDTYSGVSPISGKDIKLTIDTELQNYIFEKLKDKVEGTEGSTGGSVIVINPRTGEIIALVNFPTYNIQKFSDGISSQDYLKLLENPGKPFFNRSVSGVYPPGSVFKLVTAAGILEEDIAQPNDTIFDKGYIEIKNYRYNNWKLDGHGLVDLDRAMAVSNDTYFYIYTAGFEDKKGLGVEKLHDWALKFNFSKLTGIDLPGEAKGFMPDGKYKQWYLGDTFITAIGQGDVLATPLQTTLLMSYFAGNQVVYKPYLVSEIDNKVRKNSILYSNLLSKENFETIKKSLRSVNDPGGTAYPFHNFEEKWGFDSAGKTGTSEFLKNGIMETHAWYSGFAPYEDAEIVVTVFLEDGGGGSDDAAPLTREIMDYYFSKKSSTASRE